MKNIETNTVVIRDAALVLRDFNIENGMLTLKKGKALPNLDEIIGVAQFKASELRSGLEVGANTIRLADNLPVVHLIAYDEKGQPKMNGNEKMLVPRPAKDVIKDRLSEIGKSDKEIASMLALIPACAMKEKLCAADYCAPEVSVFAIKDCMAFISQALKFEPDKTVLTLPEAKPVFDLLKTGKAPVNALRDEVDKARRAANESAVRGKHPLPFPKSETTEDKLKHARIRKDLGIALSADEVAMIAKADAPPVDQQAPTTPTSGTPVTTPATGQTPATDAKAQAQQAETKTFDQFWQNVFATVENLNLAHDKLVTAKAEFHAAPNECEAAIVALLRKCRHGEQLAANWLKQPKK